MSKVKFEAELNEEQFDKFTDFMVWLKNDKNFNDGSDVVNKNDLLPDVIFIEAELCDYFEPMKGLTSGTLCKHCGKEKFLHKHD